MPPALSIPPPRHPQSALSGPALPASQPPQAAFPHRQSRFDGVISRARDKKKVNDGTDAVSTNATEGADSSSTATVIRPLPPVEQTSWDRRATSTSLNISETRKRSPSPTDVENGGVRVLAELPPHIKEKYFEFLIDNDVVFVKVCVDGCLFPCQSDGCSSLISNCWWFL